MSRLALYLLGSPRIERDGVSIRVDTRKAIALLAYLAVTGERHRRDSLVNLLWPDYDSARGRTALRRTLYALRKAIDAGWLDADREAIGLHPGGDLWVDVDEFHAHLAECETHGHPPSEVCPACAAPLTEAVALHHGDFLIGFGLRDSFNFDDWQMLQAEVLRRELAGALERLERWHSAQREFDLAVRYAQQRLALDPLDETAHRRLMRLYTWSGQRPAALRQYQTCVNLLQDQLGVPPQQETTQLSESIQAGVAPPLPTDPSWVGSLAEHTPAQPSFLEGPEMAIRPVFVARAPELAQLDRHLEAALRGQGKVVFVTGDAGSGKTALIQEFTGLAQAAQPEMVAASGHGNAHTGAGDPYLPFREILGLLTGDIEAQWAAGTMTREQARRLWDTLPWAARALVEVGPDLIELFVPGTPLVRRALSYQPWPLEPVWQTQLKSLASRAATSGSSSLQQGAHFEQYTQVLRTLASQRPLLLTLDDLQWADGASLDLLFHLGRRIGGSRILIVGAYRPAEVALGRPAPLPAGGVAVQRERHPLEPLVNEFRRTFGEVEVDLEQAEGRQFVDAFLDSEPNRLAEGFRETLHQHTLGHPLFTVELLRGMQERGDLEQDGEGHWVEGPSLDWETMPSRVEAVIAERIGRLPDPLRSALTVASVEGETFTAEVMACVEGIGEGETIRCLSETLDRRHRLVSAQGVVQMDDRRLSRYRFRHILFQKHLYNSLDSAHRAHLHEAVGTALERLYGEAAGEPTAVASAAVHLARHFHEAGNTGKAIDYLAEAGEQAQRLYANAEAVEYFRRALDLLEDPGPPESWSTQRPGMAARLYEGLAEVLEWMGDHEEASESFQLALVRVPQDDPVRRARLQRKIGNVRRLQRRYERALEAYERAETALGPELGASTPEGRQEWVQIQLERMWLHYWLGQWHEMSELAGQVRPSVERHGTPAQCVNFFLSLASMYNRRDRYAVSAETLACCQTALAISQETEDLGHIAWARFMLGFSQLWAGDLDGAVKQMQSALALAQRTGDIVHQSRCLNYLTIAYRKREQLEQARDHASRTLEVAKRGEMLEYIGTAKANLAWLAWREGDLAGAVEYGRAALEQWQQLPAAHSSCAFEWTALLPLVAVALAQDRASAAVEWARGLLDSTQQRLPTKLETLVDDGIAGWEEGEPETAHTCFERAVESARELGYL